ncbi:MAG: hypothetical protein PUF65_08875 [Lachnospiraceae bacterium]|nr:hypothetical protein [Lachnospiraceae bacterium]
MFCNNCGAKIPNETEICPECGQKCKEVSGMRIIRLKCKNCNGIMEVDENTQEVICPYCGTKEKILDSDAVAVEKIKSNTSKEVEFAKMANEKEKEARKEKRDEQEAYRKGKLCKITVIATFICLLFMFYAFKTRHILAGIIAVIQICMFAVSWLMGMQIIKEKKKFVYMALAILGFLFIIPFGLCCNVEKPEKLEWPESGIATELPNPKAKYGEIIVNDDEDLYIIVEKYSKKDYKKYVQACQNAGYTLENKELEESYEAYNDEGYQLSLTYVSDTMDISLTAPIMMGEFEWPDSEIAKLLPQPKSNIGKIDSESEDGLIVYVGNTSAVDYEKYVDEVRKAGFKKEYQKGDTYYWADNKNGYHIEVRYEGNDIMWIRLDSPDEAEVQEADDTGSKKDSELNEGTNDESKSDKDDVNPDLKAFLDEYEDFVDRYVEFMNKYNQSDADVTMLADYADILKEYDEFNKSLEKYDADTMSESDAAYYIEVTTRCSEKLAKVAL